MLFFAGLVLVGTSMLPLTAVHAGASATTQAGSSSRTYATNFSLTENPISEGGNWIGGQSAGGNLWGDIQTNGTMAFGVSEPTTYGDPTAVLTGSWGADQSAGAVTRIVSTPTGTCCHEAEVRLRTSISANLISGYEVYCSVMPSPNNYCHIATWGGPNGIWNNLADYTGPLSTLRDGDILLGTATGTNPTVITAYVNGTQIMQVSDTGQAGWGPWTSGNPGIGFYDNQDTDWSNFGFSSFTAADYFGITATPPSIDFGSVSVGQSSTSHTLTVSNTGGSDIHVGLISVSGANAGDFAIQNDQISSQTLTPGQSRTLEVVLTPGAAGLRTASLDIPSDDPNKPVLSVPMQGSGLGAELWSDTFSDGDASDWTATKGTWTVSGGDLTGTYYRKADDIAPFSGCRVCRIEAELRVETPGGRASLLAWYIGKKNLVEIRMMDDKDKWLLIHKINGETVVKAKAMRTIVPDTDYHISAVYDGSSLQVSVDGETILTAVDSSVTSGEIGFRVKSANRLPVTIASREIYVYP